MVPRGPQDRKVRKVPPVRKAQVDHLVPKGRLALVPRGALLALVPLQEQEAVLVPLRALRLLWAPSAS